MVLCVWSVVVSVVLAAAAAAEKGLFLECILSSHHHFSATANLSIVVQPLYEHSVLQFATFSRLTRSTNLQSHPAVILFF